MPSKYIGMTFGKYKVIDAQTKKSKSGHPKMMLTVRCECGAVRETQVAALKKSAAPMCRACYRKQLKAQSGEGTRHPLYRTWWGMLLRCHDPSVSGYPNYGGRGIRVCQAWRGSPPPEGVGTIDGFRQFVADMGDKPSPRHSLGRIDNDGGYSVENCRWETPSQQANNTRANIVVEVDGLRRTVTQWARVFCLPSDWYARCLKFGKPPEEFLRFAAGRTEVRLRWKERSSSKKPPEATSQNVKLSDEDYALFSAWFTP